MTAITFSYWAGAGLLPSIKLRGNGHHRWSYTKELQTPLYRLCLARPIPDNNEWGGLRDLCVNDKAYIRFVNTHT